MNTHAGIRKPIPFASTFALAMACSLVGCASQSSDDRADQQLGQGGADASGQTDGSAGSPPVGPSGGYGGAGAANTGGGGADVDPPCDCSAERPCPLLCQMDLDGYPAGVEVCAVIHPDEPCPQETREGWMVTSVPQYWPHCGAIAIGKSVPVGSREIGVHMWFDPVTYEQIGWEVLESPLAPYQCAGIVPDPESCTFPFPPSRPIRCGVGPYALTCECPPPECEASPRAIYCSCQEDSECASGQCEGTCTAAATCSNGILDGTETDVDCGGPGCVPCPAGGACVVDHDCRDRQCSGGTCGPDTCFNSVQDGLETDVDCGGKVCPPCAVGQSCLAHDDCASGQCPPASLICTDG
jgi:hypothetical protein